MSSIRDSLLISADTHSVYSAQDAARVIHGCVDERGMTTQKAREYLEIIRPFIYDGTPLYAALQTSTSLYPGLYQRLRSWFFPRLVYHDEKDTHQRLLFVLSDGEPTDTGDISLIKTQLQQRGVKAVGCYITNSYSVQPRRLYSVSEAKWAEGAKFLFDLSSVIPTEAVTRAIFIKHGWHIDIDNNETRLFMHVNHPDHLRDACKLARNAVFCQDALSDLLVSVSLDLYINQKNAEKVVYDQGREATCYAHAAATVMHLAMLRILGRDGGYPDFEQLRDEMITRHGRLGANTLSVLQEVCPHYRLHCRKVDCQRARQAVTEKRPVVARFWLTQEKMDMFYHFYRNERNRERILRKSDFDTAQWSDGAIQGHAVVLTSYNSECLYLMNSWGDTWGDNGFFRVENADVLGLEFIDVNWTKDDLSEREKEYYRTHGSEVAVRLMRSLKALQVATFTCPLCGTTSNVSEFRGTLLNAVCPRCQQEFSSNDGNGNILALNMYLTSLSR